MEGVDRNFVRSLGKGLAVLSAFRPDTVEMTLTEVAERTALDRGTAFRLLHTLVTLGYVRHLQQTKRFRLTLKCLELGFAALSGSGLSAHAQPLLNGLVPAFADAASVGMLERGEVVYLERVQVGLNRPGLDRRAGSRTGAYATALGHAILAHLPRALQIEQLESIERIKVSETTLVDLDALLERLDRVRERGFAVSDGENAYGLRTVAMPLFDRDGRPLAAVSVSIQAGRMPLDDFVQSSLPPLGRVAAELTEGVRLSFGAIGVEGGAR